MSNIYHVYIWYHKEMPVYVGMGKNDRWKHGNSGQSHVYGLNKIHFLEGRRLLNCKIFKDKLSLDEALSLERNLIDKYKTPFNKENNNKIRNASRKNIERINAIEKERSRKYYKEMQRIVVPLMTSHSNSKIAEILNDKGLLTLRGASWNKGNVQHLTKKINRRDK